MSGYPNTPSPEDPYSVSQLSMTLKYKVNQLFPAIWVEGEVSNVTYASSGHIYFSIKDSDAKLDGVVWRSNAEMLGFTLEKGQEVLCFGGLDVYPQRGVYQLNARKIQPKGEGSLELAFKQLHAKLQKEGLFAKELKKPIPRFPKRVAVVTSPNGAAVRDFLQVLQRRWRAVEVIIVPTKVQGPGSARQIAYCIDACSRFADPPDVVVVTRGGGSREDLWAFNEEPVVRAIHRCPIPVISGVGHEIDTSLSDLAADVRALTPSEAAERLVPDRRELLEALNTTNRRMRAGLSARMDMARAKLDALAARPAITRPLDTIRQFSRELDEIETRSQRLLKNRIQVARNSLTDLAARVESINPLAVLARGYSMTTDLQDQPIHDASQLNEGDMIKTRLNKGSIVSRVEKEIE